MGPCFRRDGEKRIQLSNRLTVIARSQRVAMTLIEFRIRLRPRGARRPRCCIWFPPKEGVGNAGCPLHPRPRVHLVVVERTRVTTSTPESPDVPARNGFNGLLRALPGDRALLPPSPCGLKVLSSPVEPNEPPQDLTPASRRQDHTTSPSASSVVVLHAANRSRRAIRPALRFARLTLLRPPHLIPRS